MTLKISPDTRAIGLIASPLRSESTSSKCYFWVPTGTLVEKTQLIRTVSTIGGTEITFYGVVEEVFRRSRQRSFEEAVDIFDGDIDYDRPFAVDGVTFAEVSVLRTTPNILTPPLEQSKVYIGDEADAGVTYGYDHMVERSDDGTETDWRLPVGLLRNGGRATVGVARVDLRDLDGDRAGHLNVTGQAGRGTKSSFLLTVVRSLIDTARRLDDGQKHEPFSVRPIVFNVKGTDLMFIDMPNRHLTSEAEEVWSQMGIEPRAFSAAEFRAPCRLVSGQVNREDPRVIRPASQDRQARTYYWTLADVVRHGLWTYLFSDETQSSESMMAMVDHVLGVIAEDCSANDDHPAGLRLKEPHRSPNQDYPIPQTFRELRDWLRQALRDKDHHPARDGGIHTHGTCRALISRLGLVLDQEGRTIFADDLKGHGRPLAVVAPGTTDPLAVDIAALPAELRRFVVAAVLDQVKANQMGPRRIRGQVYFLLLDELGIYAPRGARDPITKLFEHVAAQLRSQGIILLGAQQHASHVSEAIFGNSEFKVLGASSPVELESPTWNRLLTPAQKTRALMLGSEEKMILTGRGWMNVVVPFPAWAMKESEVQRTAAPATVSANGSAGTTDDANSTFRRRLNLPRD